MTTDLPSIVVPLSRLEVGPFSADAVQLGFGRQGVLAVVRESRSPGSTKRVLTTNRAIAARKPLLQPDTAHIEHAHGIKHRQEPVRKLAHQAGQQEALRAKADAPTPCKYKKGRSWEKTVEEASLLLKNRLRTSARLCLPCIPRRAYGFDFTSADSKTVSGRCGRRRIGM